MQILRTDVAVVGAGPIGLELAVALKRAGIDYQHFDAKQIGYTVSWFAPGTRFFSSNERIAIAGVPLQTPEQGKATREEYLAYLRGVVEQFDLKIHTFEPVVNIARKAGGFEITTRPVGGPRVCAANKLVLVTGGTDRPRRLDIPGEDLPHVSHYFQDPHLYFRKKLLIVGGKNSAIEAALRCHHAGAQISLSYRRAALSEKSIKYWLLPEINGLIESGRMPAYFQTLPTRITENAVTLSRTTDGEWEGESDLPFDFVLLLIGYEQDDTLLRLAGVEQRGDCNAPLFDDRTMQTTVPNLYIAGTAVAGTQDKYRVFIENCHVHVERIMAALTGTPAPQAPQATAMPES
ncbi:MAG TPA: NAD(P)-binding domain-containing protein [Tepidisphaeraceae bacterium]|nr:NAD(P)-binding domain-containing protein [Tepidisphaeraceae bacterium]